MLRFLSYMIKLSLSACRVHVINHVYFLQRKNYDAVDGAGNWD